MRDVSPETVQTLQALAWHRHQMFADLLTLVLGIAAETHPEEIKKAMAHVFDLEGYLRTAEAIHKRIADLNQHVQQYPHLLQAINQDVDRLEKRLDALLYEFERLEQQPHQLKVAK